MSLAACGAACGASGPSSAADTNDLREDPVGVVSDAGSLSRACARAAATARRTPIYMLIVLDGSGSMQEQHKWDAVVSALDKFFENEASHGDGALAVGLTVFSDSGDRTGGFGPYPRIDVPIRALDEAQAQALSARIDHSAPLNETPLAAALTGQYPLIEGFAPDGSIAPGGDKVLVLMTDGVPYPNPGLQRPVCLAAARAEATRHVTTFAVGIGPVTTYDANVYDPRFMGALATAGGAPRADCDPQEISNPKRMCHLQVTPDGRTPSQLSGDFLRAIDDIRSAVASCELTLENVGGEIDPAHVNVVYADARGVETALPAGPVNGWTYDDPGHPAKVVLHGEACAKLKSEPEGKVSVVVGCRTILK